MLIDFLRSKPAEDKYFECKAFLHFDTKLSCLYPENPFHSKRPNQSILALRVIESIIAFANAEGGILLLGVAEYRSGENEENCAGIPVSLPNGETKYILAGVEQDKIGYNNKGIFDTDKYKLTLQNILFPKTNTAQNYCERSIKSEIKNKQIIFENTYSRTLVEDIKTIQFDDNGTNRTVAVIKIVSSDNPILIYEVIESSKSVTMLYKRLAFNNNGPLVGQELMEYIRGGHTITAPSPALKEELVPKYFFDELKKYIVPIQKGTNIAEKILNLTSENKNIFIVGESGQGKSLLMSYCFLNFELQGLSCYYSIDRTQGPEVYCSAPVLCSLREQIMRLKAVPPVIEPPRSEAKALWLWEKEYLERLLSKFSAAYPDKRLVVFLDGLDENYLETRESEFILNILKPLIQNQTLNVIWILSSQVREGMEWIDDYFCRITLHGLGLEEARKLLLKNLPSGFEVSHPDYILTLLCKCFDPGGFDPEMLAVIAQSMAEKLGGKNIAFFSEDVLKSFFADIELNARKKYSELYRQFTDDTKLRSVPSLRDNAEKWDGLVKNSSYNNFLADILAILSLTKRPVPAEILVWMLTIEDKNSQTDFRGKQQQQFKYYPEDIVENKGFLQIALKDLQRVIKINDAHNEQDISFCKESIRDAFSHFLHEDKNKEQSARKRLATLASESISLFNSSNLNKIPSYLFTELLYLLSLDVDAAQNSLTKLFYSDCFPEWLQGKESFSKGTKWVTEFIQDIKQFLNLPEELNKHINKVLSTIRDWAYHLNHYPEATAALIRNEKRLTEIWPPKPVNTSLLIPCNGFSKTIECPGCEVTCIEVLSENHIAGGYADGTIRVWDIKTGECILLEGHNSSIEFFETLSDGRLVSAGRNDAEIIIWNIETGENKILQGPSDGITDLIIVANSYLVASSFRDEIVRIFNLKNGEIIQDIELQGDVRLIPLTSGCFAVGFYDGVLIVDSKLNQEYIPVDSGVWPLEFLPDNRLAVGSNDGNIFIIDLKKNDMVLKLKTFSEPDSGTLSVLHLKHLSNNYLASSNVEGKEIIVWDLESGKPTLELKGTTDYIYKIEELSDNYLISGGIPNSETIKVWSLNTGELVKVFNDYSTFCYTPDYFYPTDLFLGCKDGTICLIEWTTGKINKVFGTPIPSTKSSPPKEHNLPRSFLLSGENYCAAIPDNQIVFYDQQNNVQVWDTDNCKCLKKFPPDKKALHFKKINVLTVITAIDNLVLSEKYGIKNQRNLIFIPELLSSIANNSPLENVSILHDERYVVVKYKKASGLLLFSFPEMKFNHLVYVPSLYKIAVLPDDKLAAITHHRGLEIWDIFAKKKVAVGFLSAHPVHVVYDPGTKSIVVVTNKGFEKFKI